MALSEFDTETALLGMVHLPPLPGAPRYDGDRRELRASALAATSAGGK